MSKPYPIFKWLHLSDIHFLGKAGFNTIRIQTTLPDYLKVLREQYDCMILSGDFRYAPDGITNTTRIVDYVKKLLINTGLSNDRIIMTPGNHDLSRTETINEDIINALKDYKSTAGSIQIPCLMKLLDNFEFYNNLKISLSDNSNVITLINNPHSIVDMGSCYFLVLNTAFCASGEDGKDKGKLIMGGKYMVNLIDKIKDNPKPIIAIGHHSLDWFTREERDEILPWFDQEGIKLYLCGHSHKLSSKKVENIIQITVGCMQDSNQKNVDAAFSIGQLYSDGTVKIFFHVWDNKYKQWIKESTPVDHCVFGDLYDFPSTYSIKSEKKRIQKVNHPFTISKVISDSKGIKYIWEKSGFIVESVTINSKKKGKGENISVYTVSTSIGCMSKNKSRCKNCKTGEIGTVIPLSAEDIALQCIFMALYDINYCIDHPEVQKCSREYVFLIQGEKNRYSVVVEKAIKLNNSAMYKLGQEVPNYNVSSDCKIQTMTFSNTNPQDAGDSTIRAFNAAVRLLDDVKNEYERTKSLVKKNYSKYF